MNETMWKIEGTFTAWIFCNNLRIRRCSTEKMQLVLKFSVLISLYNLRIKNKTSLFCTDDWEKKIHHRSTPKCNEFNVAQLTENMGEMPYVWLKSHVHHPGPVAEWQSTSLVEEVPGSSPRGVKGFFQSKTKSLGHVIWPILVWWIFEIYEEFNVPKVDFNQKFRLLIAKGDRCKELKLSPAQNHPR